MYKVVETIFGTAIKDANHPAKCNGGLRIREYHARTLTGIRGHLLSIIEGCMERGESFNCYGFGDVPLLAKRVLDSRSRVVEVGRVH